MVRIITGKYGSRRLKTPNNKSVRPTKDRVKESIFNQLFNIIGSYQNKVILDLFAGTGNFGLECISRGAEQVVFVDNDYRQVTLIKENAEKLGIDSSQYHVLKADALSLDYQIYNPDLIFADPPYKMKDIDRLFQKFQELKKDSIIVFEISRHYEIPEYFKEYLISQKEYGFTKANIFKR
ncbi:MAG: 16S rRNA (guanine(966)-N(2))-methyltransferase RsmD [Candidatus Marinimicrobia bacterium]|nr:16S rRNA (guanine(966)-N(2))-methyltransferase RsmD [Candidatus Neomarinimicrobiota bacterium]